LIDRETGSCCDGLHPARVNQNRGGESVLSYLLGLVEIRSLTRVSSHRGDACNVARLPHRSPISTNRHAEAL
jgi:hypothetical protein